MPPLKHNSEHLLSLQQNKTKTNEQKPKTKPHTGKKCKQHTHYKMH